MAAPALPKRATRPVSIGLHLVFLVLVTALPLIAFAVGVLLWHSRNEQTLLRQQGLRAAAVAAQSVDHELATAIAALQVLTDSQALAHNGLARFHEKAKSAGGVLRDSVIVVYDRAGNRLVSTAVAYGHPLPRRTDMAPFAPPFETRQPHVTTLFSSGSDGHAALAVVVPVVIADQVRYVVTAGVKPARLAELLTAGLPPGWTAKVIDQNGIVVATTDNGDEPVGAAISSQLLAHLKAAGARTGVLDAFSDEGEPVLTSFSRSRISGWSAVVEIPPEALRGELHRSLSFIAAASAPVLAIALLLAWWGGRRIAAPLARLEGIAIAMEQGSPVKPAFTGVRQFDRLSVAMEHASSAIREREAKLSRSLDAQRRAHEDLRSQHEKQDRFLATLAHELRNPLAPIRSGVQILAEAPPAAVAWRTLEMMERELGHMALMIEDLLDVSRIAGDKLTLRREQVPLQKLIVQAAESSEPQVKAAGQQLALELPEEPVLADVDPARIRQVIVNLVQNAVKFSAAGDLVRIALSVSLGTAEIRVIDTGVGIAPEHLDHVFELFYQVTDPEDAKPAGLGLGLTISRRLVELHGGEISASSEGPGRGATFLVRLPCSAAGEASDTAATVRREHPSRLRRVMVVDDNRVAADAMGTLLRLRGHTVHVAYDAACAQAIAGEHELDVMLIDIGMPGMDGYELCRALRRMPRHARATIVALTGWGSDRDVRLAQEAGFNAHLTKPASWEEIQAVLHERG